MASSSSEPYLQKVAEMLMKNIGKENKSVSSRSDSSAHHNVTFLVYSYPRSQLCYIKGIIKFDKGTSKQNPFNDLCKSVADGSRNNLSLMYKKALEERRRNGSTPFHLNTPATLREKAMYE